MALFKKSASKNKPGQSAESVGWVVQEGYQSGGTVLVGSDREQVLIDRPRDWPGGKVKTVIVFRDADRIRYHFQSRVLSDAGKTVYLSFPKELSQGFLTVLSGGSFYLGR